MNNSEWVIQRTEENSHYEFTVICSLEITVLCLYLYVNSLHLLAESLTCMDTCQGQECGLASSPFTMRDTLTGGMAGFPHVGQSRKWEENHCNLILCLVLYACMHLFVVCLCINKAWIYSTYLQLTDKPACCREVALNHWLWRFDLFKKKKQLSSHTRLTLLFLAFTNLLVCSNAFNVYSCKPNTMLLLQTNNGSWTGPFSGQTITTSVHIKIDSFGHLRSWH